MCAPGSWPVSSRGVIYGRSAVYWPANQHRYTLGESVANLNLKEQTCLSKVSLIDFTKTVYKCNVIYAIVTYSLSE